MKSQHNIEKDLAIDKKDKISTYLSKGKYSKILSIFDDYGVSDVDIRNLLAKHAIELKYNTRQWHLFQSFLEKMVMKKWIDEDMLKAVLVDLQAIPFSNEALDIFKHDKEKINKCCDFDDKMFCHIHNDHEIQGETVQGNVFFDTSDIFVNLLQVINDAEPSKDIGNVISLIENISHNMNWSEHDVGSVIDTFTSNSNDSLVLFGGYPGHAMLYQVTKHDTEKDAFYLDIINTGGGVNFHESIDDTHLEKSQKYSDTLRFEVKSSEDLKYILHTILKHKREESKSNASGLYRDIFVSTHDRGAKLCPVDLEVSQLINPQKSGTCTWKVLKSFLKKNIKDKTEQEYVFFMMRFLSLQGYLNNNSIEDMSPSEQRHLKGACIKLLKKTENLILTSKYSQSEHHLALFKAGINLANQTLKALDIQQHIGNKASPEITHQQQILKTNLNLHAFKYQALTEKINLPPLPDTLIALVSTNSFTKESEKIDFLRQILKSPETDVENHLTNEYMDNLEKIAGEMQKTNQYISKTRVVRGQIEKHQKTYKELIEKKALITFATLDMTSLEKEIQKMSCEEIAHFQNTLNQAFHSYTKLKEHSFNMNDVLAQIKLTSINMACTIQQSKLRGKSVDLKSYQGEIHAKIKLLRECGYLTGLSIEQQNALTETIEFAENQLSEYSKYKKELRHDTPEFGLTSITDSHFGQENTLHSNYLAWLKNLVSDYVKKNLSTTNMSEKQIDSSILEVVDSLALDKEKGPILKICFLKENGMLSTDEEHEISTVYNQNISKLLNMMDAPNYFEKLPGKEDISEIKNIIFDVNKDYFNPDKLIEIRRVDDDFKATIKLDSDVIFELDSGELLVDWAKRQHSKQVGNTNTFPIIIQDKDRYKLSANQLHCKLLKEKSSAQEELAFYRRLIQTQVSERTSITALTSVLLQNIHKIQNPEVISLLFSTVEARLHNQLMDKGTIKHLSYFINQALEFLQESKFKEELEGNTISALLILCRMNEKLHSLEENIESVKLIQTNNTIIDTMLNETDYRLLTKLYRLYHKSNKDKLNLKDYKDFLTLRSEIHLRGIHLQFDTQDLLNELNDFYFYNNFFNQLTLPEDLDSFPTLIKQFSSDDFKFERFGCNIVVRDHSNEMVGFSDITTGETKLYGDATQSTCPDWASALLREHFNITDDNIDGLLTADKREFTTNYSNGYKIKIKKDKSWGDNINPIYRSFQEERKEIWYQLSDQIPEDMKKILNRCNIPKTLLCKDTCLWVGKDQTPPCAYITNKVTGDILCKIVGDDIIHQDSKMINVFSLGEDLKKVLSRFEGEEFIEVWEHDDGTIRFDLPRYQLSFETRKNKKGEICLVWLGNPDYQIDLKSSLDETNFGLIKLKPTNPEEDLEPKALTLFNDRLFVPKVSQERSIYETEKDIHGLLLMEEHYEKQEKPLKEELDKAIKSTWRYDIEKIPRLKNQIDKLGLNDNYKNNIITSSYFNLANTCHYYIISNDLEVDTSRTKEEPENIQLKFIYQLMGLKDHEQAFKCMERYKQTQIMKSNPEKIKTLVDIIACLPVQLKEPDRLRGLFPALAGQNELDTLKIGSPETTCLQMHSVILLIEQLINFPKDLTGMQQKELFPLISKVTTDYYDKLRNINALHHISTDEEYKLLKFIPKQYLNSVAQKRLIELQHSKQINVNDTNEIVLLKCNYEENQVGFPEIYGLSLDNFKIKDTQENLLRFIFKDSYTAQIIKKLQARQPYDSAGRLIPDLFKLTGEDTLNNILIGIIEKGTLLARGIAYKRDSLGSAMRESYGFESDFPNIEEIEDIIKLCEDFQKLIANHEITSRNLNTFFQTALKNEFSKQIIIDEFKKIGYVPIQVKNLDDKKQNSENLDDKKLDSEDSSSYISDESSDTLEEEISQEEHLNNYLSRFKESLLRSNEDYSSKKEMLKPLLKFNISSVQRNPKLLEKFVLEHFALLQNIAISISSPEKATNQNLVFRYGEEINDIFLKQIVPFLEDRVRRRYYTNSFSYRNKEEKNSISQGVENIVDELSCILVALARKDVSESKLPMTYDPGYRTWNKDYFEKLTNFYNSELKNELRINVKTKSPSTFGTKVFDIKPVTLKKIDESNIAQNNTTTLTLFNDLISASKLKPPFKYPYYIELETNPSFETLDLRTGEVMNNVHKSNMRWLNENLNKNGSTFDEFKTHLDKDLIPEAQKLKKKCKQKILTFVEQNVLSAKGLSSEQINNEAMLMSGQQLVPNMSILLSIYLKKDISLYSKLLNINPSDAITLNELIRQYLVESLNIKHMNDISKNISIITETSNSSEEEILEAKKNLITSLNQSSHLYDFSMHPERLVFEYHKGFNIREKQIEILDVLEYLEKDESDIKPHVSKIIKLAMGQGKTSVLTPLLCFSKANGNNLLIYQSPSSLVKTNYQDLSKNSKKFFGQSPYLLEFDRNEISPTYLKTILDKLQLCIANKDYIVTTPETLQRIELVWLELLEKNKSDSFGESISLLSDILNLIRERGEGLVDEVDLLLDPTKEHNFSFGEEISIDDEYIDCMINFYRFINDSDAFKELLTQGENLSEEYIKSAMVEILNMLCEQPQSPLVLLLQKQPQLQSKLKGFLLDDPESDLVDLVPHDLFNKLVLYKQLYTSMLPSFIDKKHNFNYGRSHLTATADNPIYTIKVNAEPQIKQLIEQYSTQTPLVLQCFGEYYVLGKDVQNECKITKITNDKKGIFESLEFTSELSKIDNMPQNMINFLRTENIHTFSSQQVTGLENEVAIPYKGNKKPVEGSEFSDPFITANYTIGTNLISGVSKQVTQHYLKSVLDNIKQEISIVGNMNNTPAAFAFHSLTNKSIMDYLPLTSRSMDDFHSEFSCNRNFIYHCLKEIILKEIKVSPLYLKQNSIFLSHMFKSIQGFSGTIISPDWFPSKMKFEEELAIGQSGEIRDNLIKKDPKIFRIPELSDETGIQQQIEFLIKSNPKNTAIIDMGAFFKDYSNLKIAKDIAECLKKENSKLQYVLYFDEEDKLYAYPIGIPPDKEKGIFIGSMDYDVIQEKLRCDKTGYFTYFDQLRTTGTDIKQASDGNAVVTFSNTNLTRDVMQSVMRMRELPDQQTVSFAVSPGFMSTKPEIKIKDLLDVTDENQRKKIKEVNNQVVQAKIENVLRNWLVARILKMPPDTQCMLFEKLKTSPLFSGKVTTAPVDCYYHSKQPDKVGELNENIKKLLSDWDKHVRKFKESYNVTSEDIDKRYVTLQEEMVGIVEYYRDKLSNETPSDKIVEVEKEVTKEQTKEIIGEVVDIKETINFKALPDEIVSIASQPWPMNIFDDETEFYNFTDNLSKHEVTGYGQNFFPLSIYFSEDNSSALPLNLFCSSNYFHSYHIDREKYTLNDEAYKPISYVLMLKKGTQKQFVIISPDEVDFFMSYIDKLETVDTDFTAAIFTPTNFCLNHSVEEKLSKDDKEEIAKVLDEVNFINGDLNISMLLDTKPDVSKISEDKLESFKTSVLPIHTDKQNKLAMYQRLMMWKTTSRVDTDEGYKSVIGGSNKTL